jgi:protoporphyrin/coproporphyrin ferrochelatase
MKKGILLVNLGTPDEPTRGAVYKYLKEFLLDPRVIDISWLGRQLLVRGIIAPFRSGPSSKAYKELWTPEGSPLKIFTYFLRDRLSEELGEEYEVEAAMRYQSPSIQSGLDKLKAAQVSSIYVFPLFPQYAGATTGSVHQEVMRIVSTWHNIPDMRFKHAYYDEPGMIAVFAERARAMNYENYDHILFSYHGLPERQLRKADDYNICLTKDCCKTLTAKNQFCYGAQCTATTKALVALLNIPEDKYTQCYQSRLGKDPWVQPYTSDVIKQRADAGDKKMLVFCPAFTSDCLETTIEIGVEYAEEFEEYGGEKLHLVPSLNDHPAWIETVKQIVLKEA